MMYSETEFGKRSSCSLFKFQIAVDSIDNMRTVAALSAEDTFPAFVACSTKNIFFYICMEKICQVEPGNIASWPQN